MDEESNDLKLRAEAGDVEAQLALGLHYSENYEECEDLELEQAEHWLRLAAQQGNARAMEALGVLLFHIEYEKPSEFSESIMWLRKAADSGRSAARFELARLYRGYRDGMTVDAIKLIEAPADGKDPVLYWLRKAIEVDSSPSLRNCLAQEFYDLGEWQLARDYSENVLSVPEARVHDRIESLRRMARMYAKGEGVAVDIRSAIEYLETAVELGSQNAEYELAALKNGQSSWCGLGTPLNW